MKPTLLLFTMLAAPSMSLADGAITVVSWGGAYSQAQDTAFNAAFETQTGIRVNMVDADDPAIPLQAQVHAGNVTTDVASLGSSDAVRLCDEGMLTQIDPALLSPAPDGTPAAEDFLPGGLSDCFVATDVYSTIIAYDESRFPDNPPSSLADFFDTETYPGRRGVLKEPRFTLEMALMADGVPAAQVYEVLSTPEGLDRAFAKLDTIKDEAIFWEAGAQPPQLLVDGEVVMTQAYNGRIFNAAVDDGKPLKIIWDGQVYEMDGWVIPKGAPNPKEALDYVTSSTGAQPLADFAMQISYGPPRKSAAPLVGNYKDTDIPMTANLPTTAANMANALAFDNDFWVDNLSQLNERFAAWLAS